MHTRALGMPSNLLLYTLARMPLLCSFTQRFCGRVLCKTSPSHPRLLWSYESRYASELDDNHGAFPPTLSVCRR